MDFASLCGIHKQTVSRWVRGQEISLKSCLTIADALERHFAAEGVRLAVQDVAEAGLVDKIREQLEERVAERTTPTDGSRPKALMKLLDDVGVVRLLGIDGALREWLLGIAPSMRPDLTDQDWAEVVRIVKAGKWNEEGWLFMDPDVVSVNMHFKIPKGKTVTDAERRKLRGILQKELDKLWGTHKKPESES